MSDPRYEDDNPAGCAWAVIKGMFTVALIVVVAVFLIEFVFT